MSGPTKKTERDPAQWMEAIKKDFDDFTVKNESPEFVAPEDKRYDKVDWYRGWKER